MHRVRKIVITFLIMATSALSCAWASGTEDQPMKSHVWQGTIHQGRVAARIVLQCAHPSPGDRASLRITGLRPHGLYSAALIGGDGSRHRIGSDARANDRGELNIAAGLDSCPVGSTETVQVDYHPSSAKAVTVLRGTVHEQ